MEERVHPIPFRTWKLSSPSPMILHNVMWESRPLPTSFKKPLPLKAQGLFAVLYSFAVACYCRPLMPPQLLYGGFFAALYLGRLRGGRRGGLFGAAAPPRPPLHSPRTTPPGFPYPICPQSLICTHSGQSCWAFQVPPACEGCASFAAGASLPSVG